MSTKGTQRIYPFTGEGKTTREGNPFPQCFICGADAKFIDPHFPYHWDRNVCELHSKKDPALDEILDLGWNTETKGNGKALRAYLGQRSTQVYATWAEVLREVRQLNLVKCCPTCGKPE